MARAPRSIIANEYYHVLNRANRRAEVFHEPFDYHAFVALMAKAQQRLPLPILAVCLMPNHVHLVVRPSAADDLARWTQWLFATHARHYHQKYKTTGHVWQGRFKSFLIQDDHYLLTVLRYVERNALSAKLVSAAEDWSWGSLNWRRRRVPPLSLTPSPLELPGWWTGFVNQPQTAAEIEAIRTSLRRQRPFGDPGWVRRKAEEQGLKQSLTSVGRPRKGTLAPFPENGV
jgi:putative transposase